jgi:hypothetical protein
MLVKKRFGKEGKYKKESEFMTAEECFGKRLKYKKNANNYICDNYIEEFKVSDKVYNLQDWLLFFGIWYAEGCATCDYIHICAHKQRVKDTLNKILPNMNIEYKYQKCGTTKKDYIFIIKYKKLYEYWFTNGIISKVGSITFENGTKYKGEIMNHIPNGNGCAIYSNGSVYDGNWENGKYHGYGNKKYTNGNVYDGNWEQGICNGYGIMYYSNQSIYKGYWINGLRNGHGVEEYPDISYYDGNWVNSLRDGKGTHINRYGDKYNGNWKNGYFHGYGDYEYSGKDPFGPIFKYSYNGQWHLGKRHGKGKYSYENDKMKDSLWDNGILLT